MSNSVRSMLIAGSAALMLIGAAGSAFSETPWQANHPRRTEVNARLANQNRRIHQQVRSGSMSHAQAAALHRDDRQIRGEERAMASQQGSHITKSQQRALNQQENGVSRQIGH